MLLSHYNLEFITFFTVERRYCNACNPPIQNMCISSMHIKQENGASSLQTKKIVDRNISTDILDIHVFIAGPFMLVWPLVRYFQ